MACGTPTSGSWKIRIDSGADVHLPPEQFRTVVASTPLVSLDLIVENADGQLLLGVRRNRPAAGYWFVPGGRVFKGETLETAFHRLTWDELGMALERNTADVLGVYEHIYDDSVFADGTTTHYVVVAHHLHCALDLDALPLEQHQVYRWWRKTDMADDPAVHVNTKAYLSALRTA